MSYIVAILGYSRSGKDTIASEMTGYRVKFAGLMKRTFEEWYGLERYALEDEKVRNSKPEGSRDTYLKIMVKAFHAWDEIDPLLTIRPTIREIKHILSCKQPVIITDVRKPKEATALVGTGYPVHVINVKRDIAKAEPSDMFLETNLEYLRRRAASYTVVENNKNKDISALRAYARELDNKF